MSNSVVPKAGANDLIAQDLAATPKAVWAILLRRAQDTAGALSREAPATSWHVTNTEEQRMLVLTANSGPLPDLNISCHVGGPPNGPATLTLKASFAAGTVLQRWHRRRTAEQFCHALIQDVADTLTISSGNLAVRGASRRSQRGTVRIGSGESHWSGELVDISDTGIAMSVLATVAVADREAPDRWVGKATQARVRLAKSRVELPVTVAHVTRRRHDYLVGLRVLDSAGLTVLLPAAASGGLKLFHLPRKAAR
jgi:hypothetical protein